MLYEFGYVDELNGLEYKNIIAFQKQFTGLLNLIDKLDISLAMKAQLASLWQISISVVANEKKSSYNQNSGTESSALDDEADKISADELQTSSPEESQASSTEQTETSELDVEDEVWIKTEDGEIYKWSTEIPSKLIQEGKCPDNFTLIMHEEREEFEYGSAAQFPDACFEMLFNALETGNCPKNFCFSLYSDLGCSLRYNGKYDFSAIASKFAELLESGKLAKGFTLRLEQCSELTDLVTDSAGTDFARALQSGNCPENLTLNFGRAASDEFRVGLLQALTKGKPPENLTLVFQGYFGENSENSLMEQIAEALSSGNCPSGLYLDFSDCEGILDGEAVLLARVLQSGRCPANLTIDLTNQRIRDAAIKVFALALQHDNCPGLSLKLCGNVFSDEGAVALAEALKSNNHTASLNIDFGNCEFNGIGVQSMLAALKSTFIKNVGLTISEHLLPQMLATTNTSGKLSLVNVLKSRRNCEELAVLFHASNEAHVTMIANVLTTDFCSGNLCVDISCNIFYENVENATNILKNAILSGKCPSNLKIGGNLKITLQQLLEIIQHPNCPIGLQLYFDIVNIDQNVAVDVIKALAVNTKVTHLNLLCHNGLYTELNYAIQYYCLRNRLLQLFPNYAYLIKQITQQKGMLNQHTEAEITEPQTLKNLAYASILFNKLKAQNILPSSLSQELSMLETIRDNLKAEPTARLSL